MATTLSRWERLFSSKRKVSSSALKSSSTPSTSEPSSPTTPLDAQFPSPSFIRPKTSRMTARNEAYTKQKRPCDLIPDYESVKAGKESLNTLIRSGSFDDDADESFFCQINHFPQPPKDHFEQLPLPETLSLESIFDGFLSDGDTASSGPRTSNTSFASEQANDTGKLGTLDVEHLVDLINKRASKQSENKIRESNDSKRPKESKELTKPKELPPSGPVADWDITQSPSSNALIQQTLLDDIQKHFEFPEPKTTVEATSEKLIRWRDSEPASDTSTSSSLLSEPEFRDFMALTDDDIAEPDLTPQSSIPSLQNDLPPTPPLTASSRHTSPSASRTQSMLTLSPPYASKPAAAAAYESARIALKYDFDLVYVVNLWPDTTRPRGAGSRPGTSQSNAASPHHLTGRLLAAYGLENVASPFQISAPVHAKILRQEGWIEYRSQEAEDNVFSRGYACSFFTGQMTRSNSVSSNMSASSAGQSSAKKTDRGLVFAAYRKPKADGTMRFSDKSELKSIRNEAEGLVEMLMDIYVAHRLRQAPIFTEQSETGPIPAQNLQSA